MLKLPGSVFNSPMQALMPWTKPRKQLRLTSTAIFYFMLLPAYALIDSLPKGLINYNEIWWTSKMYYRNTRLDVMRKINI
mmetsp:Transcript_27972/g.50129  ORF Transcript_27972/g.50129 Transcript_27972/m.50129 type:complete len:80 (+) Transcript_27972:1442-1681(+)